MLWGPEPLRQPLPLRADTRHTATAAAGTEVQRQVARGPTPGFPEHCTPRKQAPPHVLCHPFHFLLGDGSPLCSRVH